MNIFLALLLTISTSTFERDFQSLKPGESIPTSFAVEYLKAEADQYGTDFQYELRFKPIFGDTYFPALVYNKNTGVCDEDFLVIFDENGNIKSELKIHARCDHDYSVATYKIWSFEIEPEESLIYLNIRGVKVKDDTKISEDGKVVGAKSILDVETEPFNGLEVYTVSADGTIERLSL